jgi:hypothetical protein
MWRKKIEREEVSLKLDTVDLNEERQDKVIGMEKIAMSHSLTASDFCRSRSLSHVVHARYSSYIPLSCVQQNDRKRRKTQ